jgi:hypothetical protein
MTLTPEELEEKRLRREAARAALGDLSALGEIRVPVPGDPPMSARRSIGA